MITTVSLVTKKSLFPCSENFYSLSNFQTHQAIVLTSHHVVHYFLLTEFRLHLP